MRFLTWILALSLLLGGCFWMDPTFGLQETVPYSEMRYTRPDPAALEEALSEACAAAVTAKSTGALMNRVYDFYDVYDSVLTNWYLADLKYCGDLTDSYWESEYNYCSELIPQLDAALEQLYTALALSPLRPQLEKSFFGEGFFAAYEGDPVLDETYLALIEEEARLESEYYALSDEVAAADPEADHAEPMAALLAQLVAVRQEMAAYLGYESYADFAYYEIYYRSYTPEMAQAYLLSLKNVLLEDYIRLSGSEVWEAAAEYCDAQGTFGYLKEAATNMGGTVKHAFDLLEEATLYDIAYGENKYDSSFCVYLWSYEEPFIFVSPWLDQTDKLTFAHEFGHFVNDYVCGGSYAGTDVAEVHSQAFEYLSLCYTENSEALARYKLADSLSTFVECAAYALFEHRLYALPPEELTAENILALYEQTCREFGFNSWDWDPGDFMTVVHFFTEPMYMVSYTVSNDVAMQFYQLERQTPGTGLALYEKILQSQDTDIIAFAETYGLENPFAIGRATALKKTFDEILP